MEKQNELEINLVDLFYHLKKKIWIIVAACLLGAVLGGLYTALFMETEYTASTRMYVLSRSSESAISSSDYSVSNYMIKDYEVLITGQNVTKKVIKQLNLNMTDSQLTNIISVEAIDNTRVLQISVVDNNAQRAADIANCVREVSSKQIKEIMNVEVVNLVYEAEVPQQKSGPNLIRNTVLVAALGVLAAIGVLVVIYVLDDTIRTEQDVERYLGLSVLGVIPQSAELAIFTKNTGSSGKSGSRPAAKQLPKKN